MPQSAFAQALADVVKAKEVKQTAAVDPYADETEAERKLRLKRESRRLLRVRFKPDSTLVTTHFFTSEPDERRVNASTAHGAADVLNEGRRFKDSRRLPLSEADDDDTVMEETNQPWPMGERSDSGKSSVGSTRSPKHNYTIQARLTINTSPFGVWSIFSSVFHLEQTVSTLPMCFDRSSHNGTFMQTPQLWLKSLGSDFEQVVAVIRTQSWL